MDNTICEYHSPKGVNASLRYGRFAMKTLKLSVLMILLAGSAVAQTSSTTSGPSDVTVLQVHLRFVEPGNPKLDQPQIFTNADAGARRAVNAARMNEFKSRRDLADPTPPPALLAVPDSAPVTPTARRWSGFIYEITVKNSGTKTIRQLDFDYSFPDLRTQQSVGRRHYKSKVKIHPGMTAKLVVRSYRRPMGTVAASKAAANQPDQSPEQVEIQRIKYADGSMWQRSVK